MEGDRAITSATQATKISKSRSQTHGSPSSPDGDSVCITKWDSLGNASARTGMWCWDELLAVFAPVAGAGGYDSEPHRCQLRARSIVPLIRKRGTEHGSGLGSYRWVVERTLSWLHQFRRLRVRYERRDDIHEAPVLLGCIMICWSALVSWNPLC